MGGPLDGGKIEVVAGTPEVAATMADGTRQPVRRELGAERTHPRLAWRGGA